MIDYNRKLSNERETQAPTNIECLPLYCLKLIFRPTLKYFCLPLPDPVLPVWVGRSEIILFYFPNSIPIKLYCK